MKLIYFVQYFRPEKSSGGVLVEDLLEGFVKNGWEVDVYTPMPTRGISVQERRQYYRKNKKNEVLFDGKLVIHRMRLYREGKGFVPRAIRYILFSLQCLWKGLTVQADAVFTGSGPPTQGLVGAVIHKLTKKKFIYNLQDIFPDSMINAGMCTEKSLPVKMGRVLERMTYKNADTIITVSEDMRKNILHKGVPVNKVQMVRNWIDVNGIIPVAREENPLFDELGLPRDKFYVTYAGNLGYVQGIDYVVEAASALTAYDRIAFVIFGNGSEEEKITRMVQEYNLKNVFLYPLQPVEKLAEVYSLGDVSLISSRPGVGGAGMPSKTWIIMSSGTAVLGIFDCQSELAEIICEAECGSCVEPGNVEEICREIIAFHNDPDWCRTCGRNARMYAEEHISKEKAVAEYVRIAEAVCTN